MKILIVKGGIKMPLSEDSKNNLIDAMQHEWDAIAHDCLCCNEKNSLKGAAVRSIIGDRFYSGEFFFDEGNLRTAAKDYTSLPNKERRAILLEAFPDETYGY